MFKEDVLSCLIEKPISGLRPKGGIENDSDGIPSLGGENVLNDGGMTYENIRRIPESFYRRMPKGHLRPMDVLINKDGAQTGKVGIYDGRFPEAAVNEHLFILRSEPEKLDQHFLYYAILNPETQLKIASRITGSAQPGLNSQFVNAVHLRYPEDINSQKKIAKILSTLDEAIEQTEALIEKTKKIKAGLMQDLFTRGVLPNGQLRPPRDQAPHLYNDSPLGWIPGEWEVRKLGDIATVERGKFTIRPRNDPRYYGGDFPFIQTGDVAAADGQIVSLFSQTLNEKGLKVSRLFPVGTIMVTIAANIADTCILGIPMCAPDSLVGVVPNENVHARFVQLSISRRKLWLEARAPQTAQRNINLEDLRPLLIPFPEPDEQSVIAEKYEAIEKKISIMQRHVEKLSINKSGLMNDLLSENQGEPSQNPPVDRPVQFAERSE